jgi:hypothetical protein
MIRSSRPVMLCLLSIFLLPALLPSAQSADQLPSWNEGSSKQAIVAFVERVTSQGSSDFVPEPERIATFDNDGPAVGRAANVRSACFCP